MQRKAKRMSSAARKTDPVWMQFLQLGENLLNQPDTFSLLQLLSRRITNQFSCKVKLYPVEPSYPLPGEKAVQTIPSSPSPAIIEKAYIEKQAQKISAEGGENAPYEMALLLQTQDTLLAILWLQRPQSKPFSEGEVELLEGITSYVAVSMQVNRQVALKNWRYDQISLVRSVSAQIANVLDLDELCQRVTRLICASFGFYFVAIFTVEPGYEILNFRASSGSDEVNKKFSELKLKIGSGLIGTTAQDGREHIAKDVEEDPYFRSIDCLPETKAEATFPLVVEGRILGVLDIQSREHHSFHENDMLVLHSLADNIALAVESARLYAGMEKRAERLKAVLEINDAISSILDLDKLLEEVVTRIQERFSYPFVHIFTVHMGRRKVIYHSGSGARSKHLHTNAYAFDLDSPQGLIPEVARTGKPIIANDVLNNPLYIPSKLPPHDTQSEMTIPLVFGNDVLGILDLQSDQLNAFSTDDLELFEGLASVVAVSLRNATLFRSERWRREVADSFQDIARLLSENMELPLLLEKILVTLEKILPCDCSAIWLTDNVKEESSQPSQLHLAAARGISGTLISTTLENDPSVREFLNHSLHVTAPSIREPEGPFGPLGKALKFPVDYSSISVPLRAGEKVLGSLTLAHHLNGRYGSEASAISATFASYAAVAIQNARLFASAQQEAWSSTVMLQVAEACQSIASEDELLSTMSRLAPLLVGIDQCGFYLYDQIHHCFELRSWYGFHPEQDELSVQELDAIPFLKLITSQAPVFVGDPVEEIKLKSFEFIPKQHTVILLPLVSRGELLGAFLVSHCADADLAIDNKFGDQTLAILQGLTQQTAVALENIRLVETRQEEAYITAVLLQVAQAVVSENQLSNVLETTINLMPILVGIETCIIYTWSKDDQVFRPASVIAEDKALREWLTEKTFTPGEHDILDELMKSQKLSVCKLDSASITPENWHATTCFSIPDGDLEVLQTGSNWLLGFPLSIKGDFYGAMIAVEKDVPAKFQAKRVELLNGVSQQIALAIQDDHLNQEMIIRERMEKEIQLARQIQKTFLPETLPQIEGWKLDLRWNTAREVGGDFYDVFRISDDKYAFAIADVSDKGMPAALYMTVTRTLIRSSAQSLHSPAKILSRVNELLALENQTSGMFVTAVLGVLDPENGEFEYAIAGHNLPLLRRETNGQVENLKKGGIAMSVIENAEYEDHCTVLKPGDSLLLYTDGVTETFSPEEEAFAETRLIDSFNKAYDQKELSPLEYIEEELANFRGKQPLSDDVTMIHIQKL
jgi:serine phosphatase RsbU (regulator of sigma subunit)/putative methionine-R-sulfoxide reductase with GAF domain